MDKETGRYNRKTYKVSPTIEDIDRCLRILGLTEREFEALYGIPGQTIKRMRYSGRKLPSKFWNFPYLILWVCEGVEV